MSPAPSRPSPAPRSRRPRRLLAAVLALALGLVAAACEPAPSPPPGGGSATGLWIGPAELSRLPASGAAWDRMVATARGSWGSPNLSDNNATHDTSTLAGALVAARTGDAALTQKTRSALMAVTRVTTYSRVLELSRNITSYVVAADVVGLPAAERATFTTFLETLPGKRLDGHSGGVDMRSTALRSANNWGAMARAATVAIDLYVGDRAAVAPVATAHRAWLGEAVTSQLSYSDTAWHASSRKAGINRRGSVVLGRSADGVIPEDQRRTGEPTSGAAAKGSYPWEALQGALVTGVLLDRAGLVDIDAGDEALTRAFRWLYDTNANPPSGDDTWQPWLLNQVSGTRFATRPATSPGKNMAWTDWTHAPR
jgi:hypothetical protein